jgi:ElaB/YqjD/DUF883 family membrane-anchored ribosome-binding protein
MNTSYTHTHNQDAHKSPERLEEEVNQARARIGERLETLSNRLSPGELLDQVLGMAREHGGEFTRNLGSQMKNNPVPLLITGIGMSWLMMASNNHNYQPRYRYGYDGKNRYAPRYTDEFSEYPYAAESSFRGNDHERSMHDDETGPNMVDKAKDAMDKVGDRVHHLKDSAKDKMDRASEAIHDNMDGIHQRMHSTREHMHSAHNNMRSAQECVTGFFQEQPVLASSLGVALGAAIGALLPATEMEDRLMGNAGEQAISKAQHVAADRYEKVRETARDVAQDMKKRSHLDGQPTRDNPTSDGTSSQAI